MKKEIYYEWLAELMDEHGDIEETIACATFAEAEKCVDEFSKNINWESDSHKSTAVGLCRNEGDEIDGLGERQWAYVDKGILPETFDMGARVPKRFQKEINKHYKWA